LNWRVSRVSQPEFSTCATPFKKADKRAAFSVRAVDRGAGTLLPVSVIVLLTSMRLGRFNSGGRKAPAESRIECQLSFEILVSNVIPVT
jgi:hypothetical protein